MNRKSSVRFLVSATSLVALLAAASVVSAQVNVTAKDVEESRRSDGFFNTLKVKLNISGDSLAGAKGIRVLVGNAADDSGKTLLKESKQEEGFNEIDSTERSEADVTIELKNSERKATSIREVSGTVEIFSPGKDPRATIVVPAFQKTVGTPLNSAGLKSAGVEITVWTKEIFEARKKAEEEKVKKEIEEKTKKAEQSGSIEDAVGALTQGLVAIFGGLMNSFASMEQNDIALNVKDSGSKVVAISFEDSEGKPVTHGGRMTMGGNESKTIIFSFQEKPPPTTRIKVFVLTRASVIKVPFRIGGVPLP
jgi:peptidoglycan hydrolase-like protein with peptidoglycan-binding domain